MGVFNLGGHHGSEISYCEKLIFEGGTQLFFGNLIVLHVSLATSKLIFDKAKLRQYEHYESPFQ